MSEIEEKILEILQKRRDKAIGSPIGVKARDISEEVDGASPQKIGRILSGNDSVGFYLDSSDIRKYVLKEDGS